MLQRKRLGLNDIFNTDSEGLVTTFKEGIDYKDPHVRASLIADSFFKYDTGGFLEQAVNNNGAKAPTQIEITMVEDILYTQLLQFFTKYNSTTDSVIDNLLQFSANQKAKSEDYASDWTADTVFNDQCFGSASELGTLIGSFALADNYFPGKKSFFHNRSGFGLGIEDAKFKESFADSFLKIFQNPNIVEECIKNTWFGRLALVENYAKTNSITSEDQQVIKQILWEKDPTNSTKMIPSYQQTNMRFFGRMGKAQFDGLVGSVCCQLYRNSNNLKSLGQILEPFDLKRLNLAVTSLGMVITISALAKYGTGSLPQYLRLQSTASTIALNATFIAGISFIAIFALEFGLNKITNRGPIQEYTK